MGILKFESNRETVHHNGADETVRETAVGVRLFAVNNLRKLPSGKKTPECAYVIVSARVTLAAIAEISPKSVEVSDVMVIEVVGAAEITGDILLMTSNPMRISNNGIRLMFIPIYN